MGIEHVHDAGDAAHNEGLRMRVLAAEDGHHLGRHLGDLQGIEVVGHDDQVGLGWQLEGGVAPVGIGKGPEPAGFDDTS